LRWVQIGTVIIIVAVTVLISVAVLGRAERYIVRQNEDYARQLAFHLNDVLFAEFAELLQLPAGSPLPDPTALDGAVRHILIGLDVTRLAIYDGTGREVYTTQSIYFGERAQAGRTASLREALNGRPMSTFFGATFPDGRRSERVLASYVPIYPAGAARSGPVVGAFAIEQDLSPILAQLQREQLAIAGLVVLLMSVLLGTLLAGLRWAGRVVAAQQAELRERNRALVELQQARDDLTSLIVHDLRSPLTAIIGYLDLLRLSNPNPESHNLLRPAITSARTMSGLITTILDLRRLQDGSLPLERQPVDLVELLTFSAEEYCGWAQRDGKDIIVESSEERSQVYADPDLLRRLVANLLSNALKHTPPGTTIRLAARRDHSETWAVLTVSDDGPGIALEVLPNVFGRYVRGGGPNKKGSTGLGLAFCKLAAEAHGGTISVDSAPGRGTTFTVLLPLMQTSSTHLNATGVSVTAPLSA
jgi:signal transduction histidine kinase